MTLMLLCGALAGLGVHLLVRLWLATSTVGGRASTGAAASLAELDARRTRQRRDAVRARDREGGAPSRPDRFGSGLLDALEDRGIRLPANLRRDLELVARPQSLHLARSVIGGLVGFVVLLVAAGVMSVFVPVVGGFPAVWAGLLGALIGGLLPTAEVSSRAGQLRRDFRHVVGSFLDLVAMNLAGGRGVPEALQSAAGISDSWAMLRIRETLETARLQGITPWAALGTLGEDTGLSELRDLAAALALVADDGAKVRQSLSARATSLRRRQLADTEGRAQARSQSMVVAQTFLAFGFLIFLIYPAIARILAS